MKKFKKTKILSLVLAAVMLMSLLLTMTACEACSRGTLDIDDTKTFAAMNILDSDTFALQMELGFEIEMYRQGRNFYANFAGFTAEIFVIDGAKYEYKDDEKVALYKVLTDAEFQEEVDPAKKYGIIDLEGARFIRSGTKEFEVEGKPSYGKLFYEEFKEADGTPNLVFFDDDGIMVGLSQLGIDGEMKNLPLKITNEIPEYVLGKFKVREGYERVEFTG